MCRDPSFFLTNKIGAPTTNFKCQMNLSQDFCRCILEMLKIRFVTSYRWVQTGVVLLHPNQSHNHMVDVQVMC
jgi:hypothetical protein